jgi:hypothetical protein
VAGVDVAGAGVADHPHAGGEGRRHAGNGVLDHEAAVRVDAHPSGGEQEKVGRRLAAGDLLGGEHGVAEIGGEAAQRQALADPLGRRGGSDAAAAVEPPDEVGDPRDRPQFGPEQVARARPDPIGDAATDKTSPIWARMSGCFIPV